MKKLQTLILILASFVACQAQKTVLKLNLEKGQEYKQISEAKVTVIQEINGQEMTMVMTIKGSVSYLVK
ncbi:MAG: hypothetical protein OQJ78_01015, partial [Ignavibacteriaceae bacterium]|nr:hypothetical protein [Ignavibacteriaceae bacterium]